MKRFLIQISVFSLTVFLSFLLILSKANGYTDAFYSRFTSPKQTNLILGTSRAAQGLQPEVLASILNREFYNYSFTIAHSPYGPTYFNSIQRKLDTEDSNGIFIVTIDPWSISSTTPNPNDSLNFREIDLCLGNTLNVNRNPNFTYLFYNLKGQYNELFFQKNTGMLLHDDGWLEVPATMDSELVSRRIANRIEMYKTDNLPYYKFSEYRLDNLIKTINYLNGFGRVFLVRLPIHRDMMAIENQLMPDFNAKIQPVIALTGGFLDMTSQNDEYKYTDGNHLFKDSGEEISRTIGLWINDK